MAIRTFLALDLDEPIRRHLAAATGDFPEAGSKIRWVVPENLHVTLKFLGDVGDDDVAAVCKVVSDVAERVEPFDFDVAALCCVPPAGAVRMVWAQVSDPAGRIASLFAQVESALGELGFPRERRAFHAHVTVGRVKFTRNAGALRAAAEGLAGATFGTQHAEGVVVYRSELTGRGPVYTPLARAVLAST